MSSPDGNVKFYSPFLPKDLAERATKFLIYHKLSPIMMRMYGEEKEEVVTSD